MTLVRSRAGNSPGGKPPPRPAGNPTTRRSARALVALVPLVAVIGSQTPPVDARSDSTLRIQVPGVPAAQAPIVTAAVPDPDPLLPPPDTCRGSLDGTLAARRQARAMLCLVRKVRARANRRPLHVSRALMRSAALKRSDLERCGMFTHTPCGAPFTRDFARAGYLHPPWAIAENLAWGSGYRGVAYATMDAWLRSPGHRRNVLSQCWQDEGVSVGWVRGWLGWPIAAVWVAHFGAHDQSRCG